MDGQASELPFVRKGELKILERRLRRLAGGEAKGVLGRRLHFVLPKNFGYVEVKPGLHSLEGLSRMVGSRRVGFEDLRVFFRSLATDDLDLIRKERDEDRAWMSDSPFDSVWSVHLKDAL